MSLTQTEWRTLAAPTYGIYAGVYPDRTGLFRPGTAFQFQPGDRARAHVVPEQWNTITKGATLPEGTVVIDAPIGTFYVTASTLRFEEEG